MKVILLITIIAIFTSCADSKEFVFTIDKPGETREFRIALDTIYQSQRMEIISNSLNDTCKIGMIVVPPGHTGKLYNIEFLSDSLSYSYFPYKASKGRLVFKHVFYSRK